MALVLAAYGVVAALQLISEFGRMYAAYGGIFIALSLLWGIIMDGFRLISGTCWELRSASSGCW
jgi:small multidrug resistance family-3 protein